LGSYTGTGTTSGSYNIYIGYSVPFVPSDESATIRIGTDQNVDIGTYQTYIAGIYRQSTTGTGNPVYVSSDGKLGTVFSSRRYKEDIADIGDASSGLMKLRPVSFHYKQEYSHGPRTVQYGLIAEEVAEVYPDLVQYDPKTGQPESVYYHLVNAMLLNEVQKQQKEISILKEKSKEMSALQEQVNKLSAQLRDLSAQVAQNKESSTHLSKLGDQLDR
jgi:hypothetical protein